MRAIRLILVVLVGAGMLVFGGSGTALACSCAMGGVDDYVGYADVVATGTLTDIEPPADGPVISSIDPVKYTVEVDRTFKGDPQPRLVFYSARFGASCGLEGMHADRRYTFFLTQGGERLTANLCGGTRPASDGFETKVARVTGPPIEAADPPSTDPSASGPGAEASIDIDDNDANAANDSGVPLWVYAAIGGVVIIAAGGVLIWRRSSAPASRD
jgi:hypothetical protein